MLVRNTVPQPTPSVPEPVSPDSAPAVPERSDADLASGALARKDTTQLEARAH